MILPVPELSALYLKCHIVSLIPKKQKRLSLPDLPLQRRHRSLQPPAGVEAVLTIVEVRVLPGGRVETGEALVAVVVLEGEMVEAPVVGALVAVEVPVVEGQEGALLGVVLTGLHLAEALPAELREGEDEVITNT